MRVNPVSIKGRAVGIGKPCYIVAEIGINWNGNIEIMFETIRRAKDAGVDAIKLQNYKTESFIDKRSETWTYVNDGKYVTEIQRDMFKRNELSWEQIQQINSYCDEIKIDWHSTPMCLDGLQELIDLNVGCLKNGSDCLHDLGLIRAMGYTRLPTAISTGMAKPSETAMAVEHFRATYNDNLILLHCTSAYPCSDDQANICRVKTLADTFECLTGFSDHTEGISAAVLAVAYGAVWYEAHFTLDKNLPGPDHAFSKDPAEMAAVVKAIRAAEKQIGTSGLGLTNIEKKNIEVWFK